MIVSLWYKAVATAMVKDKQSNYAQVVITSNLASFLRKSLETRLPLLVHQTQLQLVIVAPFPHWIGLGLRPHVFPILVVLVCLVLRISWFILEMKML